MKSRTLTSLCQRPAVSPSHAVSRSAPESFGFAGFASFTGLIAFAGFALFKVGALFAAFTGATALAALAFAFAAFGFAAMRVSSRSRSRRLYPEHGRGMPRDHELFVRRDDPGGHAALRRAYPWAVVRVCAVV